MPEIKKVKMVSNRMASGKVLQKGQDYVVPRQLSNEDAVILVACGHAKDLTPTKDDKKGAK